jgi:hypothetical protein
MPRFALALMPLTGCFFDADYSRAHLRCTGSACPSGLTCVAEMCVAADAGAGADSHDARDAPAHQAMLTCGDPGDATGTIMDSTAGHASLLDTSCGGAVYNAAETVYRIEGPGAVTIGIDTTAGLGAYVIGACTQFPTCETNTAATPSAPLTLTLTSGMHLVVVDGIVANATGTYTLYITR